MTRSSLGSVRAVSKGIWKVTVELPPDAATGKRRQRSRNVRGSKRDAERARQAMLVEAGSAPSRDLTVGEFWECAYLPDARSRLRENTVAGYEAKWEGHLAPRWADVPLRSIRPADVSAWLASLDPAGSRRFEAFKLLRQVLNRAVRMDCLASNPCDRVEVPRKPRHEPSVLDAGQAAAYLALFRGTPLEAAVLLALGCGLRRSEVVALDWGDVKDGFVTVDDAVVSVGGKAVRGEVKTAFSRRRVAVPAAIMARLDGLRQGGDETPILLDQSGNRMNPDNYSHAYRARLDALGPGGEPLLDPSIPRVPLRDLRHTSLTLALEGGGSLLAVSRRAGHSSPGVTSAFYLRPHESVDVEVADGLGALLCPDVSPAPGDGTGQSPGK